MGQEDRIENSKTRKNLGIKKAPFITQTRRRRASDAEEPICSDVITYFKSLYEAVMKTRLPFYLCISVYLVICLLGNTVMAIIFWKHQNSSAAMTLSDNFTAHNNLLFNIDLNDSSILDSSYEFDQELLKTEDFDLYHIFINESENEVRSYHLIKTAKKYFYSSTLYGFEHTLFDMLNHSKVFICIFSYFYYMLIAKE